ncbi:MAG: excinuclease ABC subunit UvrA [Candidatus Andersenbacteria bacterium CG10_big_fil_rev_8_21_14_0_10_54_11]|uniref:UvrABC system protein A n=1 Tax=Candidatus Andersenbacteria bacterium CG10_big_fil_rev_8_21_14_0_10_54_11 TaxID=1974485 RepID=A0A2M6WYN5_9BACT|nr:MAG: excinuclease ABC subunit UvrA [Candidatus Andersenbacteria bacterium CG10_big_fil_rev_8_21_14_0_10_54_11]
MPSAAEEIVIKGARVHNLQNISLKIPRNKLVVFTGLSGSGKSSLAFDTLYAEGQRRYVESLSAYARQFLGLMDKPDADQIDGLPPAISIDQKSTSRNPRSTVGTVTEIYDYLRLLFARTGVLHCPQCGRVIERQSIKQMAEQVLKLPQGRQLLILAPAVRDRKGEHRQAVKDAQAAGYARVRIDGVVYTMEEAEKLELDKQRKHSVDIVVDRYFLDERPDKPRLSDSLETAAGLAGGMVLIADADGDGEWLFSEDFACPHCDISMPALEPRDFSFNSPHGACPDCTGLGTKQEIDPDLVIPNKRLSLAEGAIKPWSKSGRSRWYDRLLRGLAEVNDIPLDVAVSKLPDRALRLILFGGGETVTVRGSRGRWRTAYEGVVPQLMRRYKDTDSEHTRSEIEQYMVERDCPTCQGRRLKPVPLAMRVAGKNIHEVVSMPIAEVLPHFRLLQAGKHTDFSKTQQAIAKQILKEIVSRLAFLEGVGLAYLTLDRRAGTLAGGEAQRIRLATQIGSGLVGVLYILDEPSIGLHQRDNQKLITTLIELRDLGNTVVVVEHDEETIRTADQVVDIGPGAGEHGGRVVFQGTPKQLARSATLTGKYLSGRAGIVAPRHYRQGNGKQLTVVGAREHNLQQVTVAIPLGVFVCVTGVSGSGKSTLINDILSRALARHFHRAKAQPGAHTAIKGLQYLDKVITIDQSPIGRTPRSNPATYTGVFTHIRDLFAATEEARVRGYKAGRFSFNVKGGRCERCQGDGVLKIEMHFLPDVYVECDECHGKRYNAEALEITYKGVTIADVLSMTVEHALAFFKAIGPVRDKLQTLQDVGLGYIHLGQSATTLSGGEAQRIKLAGELSRRATGKTLYILDEPTTGLHFDDVRRLLTVLHKLVEKGNSVLVIEHNLDVIKSADYLIDMGPDGGAGGGHVVATGTPREVAKVKASYTGQFLKKVLV